MADNPGPVQGRSLQAPRPAVKNLLLRRHLDHLRLSLHPLLSITTGLPHPDFPMSLLQYHILTEQKLDSLAHFYHQRTASIYSLAYPAPVVWDWSTAATVEEQRRRFGRFIGLRGCDSPDMLEVSESKQLEMDRWVARRYREIVDQERVMESWRTKGY